MDSATFNGEKTSSNFPHFISKAAKLWADGKAASLAKILDVGKVVAHKWQHSHHLPPFTTIVMIAKKLGCEISDIFERIISVYEAARRIGVAQRTLYIHCGDLAKQLAARRKATCSKKHEGRNNAREVVMRLVFRKMLSEGITPTHNRIKKKLTR